MKKLHVKIADTWHMVFCRNGGKIVTTDVVSKALPSNAIWANDDLAYFQKKFGNNEFTLKLPESTK